MPTYEYECEKAGHRFEAFQNMSDAPIRECPKCGGKARRMISAGGAVIVKGSGRRRGECELGQACRGCDVPCDVPPCER